jgi:hypothetical protein
MWAKTFDQRLNSWYNLRSLSSELPLTDALESINQWWFNSPWQPYYLHWDDQSNWPDPWQLLSDNVYCDLARGLGILYTITLLDRADMADAALVLTQTGYNLVQVDKTKYILNWEPDNIVNTNQEVKIIRQLTKQALHQKYN